MLTASPTSTYTEVVEALAEGLDAVQDTFAGLSQADLQRSTRLDPLDSSLRRWNVLELAASCAPGTERVPRYGRRHERGKTGRQRRRAGDHPPARSRHPLQRRVALQLRQRLVTSSGSCP